MVFASRKDIPFPSQVAINTSITSETLRLLDAIIFLVLSSLEHNRSLRSSVLLNSYLALTLPFDIARSRTLWLSDATSTMATIFTVGVVSKLVILLCEAQSKTRWMTQPGRYSPEITSGIFTLSCFSWLNQLISRGYKRLLRAEDLFPLDPALSAQSNGTTFRLHWASRTTTQNRLLGTLFASLKWQFLFPILPRLALGIFSFSQAFLISSLLEYLQQDAQTASHNHGLGFIAAAAFIFFGISVSAALYRYLDQRFLVAIRACLVSAVYRTTTGLSIATRDASSALTLMESDITGIEAGLARLHECWANPIEVALASWLLYRQIGVAFVAPLAVVLVCMAASFVVAKSTGGRRGTWMGTLQRRVGMTAGVVSNMASVKLSGLVPRLSTAIQQSREEELRATRSLRLLATYATIAGYGPVLISPAVAFAFTSSPLTIQRTFTSLAYIQLLCNPLTHLFQIIPFVMSAWTSLQRIENFLQYGTTEPDVPKGNNPVNTLPAFVPSHDDKEAHRVSQPPQGIAVAVQNGEFGWDREVPLLRRVTFQIPLSALVLVTGPVASGKSSLLKGLLGETPLCRGSVALSHRHSLAFCDQEPFLRQGSVHDNIVGDKPFEQSWYDEVIAATALGDDITALPNGDQTQVGTNGASMSGGQRKRITLARAIYARPRLVLLDDILSGLDQTTRKHIFHHVLGPEGIFNNMGTTVLFATGDAESFPLTYYGLVLRDQTVVEQRSPSPLVQGHVAKTLSASHGSRLAAPTTGRSSRGVQRPIIITQPSAQPPHPVTDLSRQRGDVSVYRTYFSRLGTTNSVVFFVSGTVFAFLYNFGIIWLEFWSASTHRGENRRPYFMGVYTMIQTLALVSMAAYIAFFGMYMAVRASSQTHLELLKTVMAAPLAFFTSVDAGVTINYFSQDISTVDTGVAMGLSNTGTTFQHT